MSTILARAAKPAYRVPSMREIRAIASNGLTVASTFSGCGGSSLGYRLAGFDVRWASEFVPAAAATYRANFPSTMLDERDIRNVTSNDILDALKLDVGELDVLDGSPPCASFSVSGKRAKLWGQVKKYSDTKQRTDDLFLEYARLVDGVRPKVFVAENVVGLTIGVARGYFKIIMRTLKALGYNVEARVLDAQYLGVPQMRRRVFFVGVRDDLATAPAFPEPLPYRYALRDVLDLTPRLSAKRYGDAAPPRELRSDVSTFVENGADLTGYAIDRDALNLEPGASSARHRNLIRSNAQRPSPTILAMDGKPGIPGVLHPTERRKFSIAELRTICGFPSDFVLLGSYEQQWERLGRAVPPPMLAALARVISERVLTTSSRSYR